jgi:hypothetical protein
MASNVRGADRVRGRLRELQRAVERETTKANRRSGEDMVRMAKAIHPGDGSTRADIEGRANPDGSYTVDFGDKAKVTEGDRGPRPFVNPVLKVLRKKISARYRRAINKAVRDTFGNG